MPVQTEAPAHRLLNPSASATASPKAVPDGDTGGGERGDKGTGGVMKHSSSRQLFDYWNHRRGNRPAPERGEIEPAAIRGVLADTFILSYDPRGGHPFRLAGTKVCALFGRELKAEPFAALWTDEAREPAIKLVGLTADEWVGLVAGVTGWVEAGPAVDLELLLLPLAYRGRAHARILGVLAQLAAPPVPGITPITSLQLGSLRHLGPAVETVAAPRLTGSSRVGRPRHGLVVVEGGRPE
jgi:hypothetical protein